MKASSGSASVGDRLGDRVVAGHRHPGRVGAIHDRGHARGATERDERDVVFLLHARTGKGVELVEQPVEERAAGVVSRHRLAQAREAVHLAAGAMLLDHPVRVQQHRVTLADEALGLLVRDIGHEAEREAGRAQLDDALGGPHVGQVVTRVREHEAPGVGLEDAVQAGHEHAGRHLGREQLVRPGEDLAGLDEPGRLGAQDRMCPGHHERGGNALVGDVAHDDADASLAEVDEVVEVAADDPGRAVVRGDLPLREVGQLARQELLLDELRDLELLLVALALGGLGGLLADELRDTDGGRGLGGERRQQPAIVGRVVLLRQPRAEVECPDELALGHQRHDERDAAASQLVERRGRELEAREVDRTGCGLEVGEERIGLRDLHRDARLFDRDGRDRRDGDGYRVRARA